MRKSIKKRTNVRFFIDFPAINITVNSTGINFMSTLFLIRHGQASFGEKNYDRLSPLGFRQSRILGEYLHEADIRFDAIYCGTMDRQVKTAGEYSLLCSGRGRPAPEIIYDSRLNEFDAEGVMKTLFPSLLREKPEIKKHTDNFLNDRAAFQKIFEMIMLMWTSGEYDMRDVSTWDEFSGGVTCCIDEIIKCHDGGKKVAVFTSGGPISVMINRVLSLSIEQTMAMRDLLVNTSITRFRYSGSRIMMASFNEYPHLELEKEAGIITYR